jgi:DNA-binding HxlR family transcriptional regulator
MKSYHQYCPIASALDLVGERWSLLVVRELLQHGQLRYSDSTRPSGCSTNILAAPAQDLERGGVVQRRKLPPPAASTVYELTEYGTGLSPCCGSSRTGAPG